MRVLHHMRSFKHGCCRRRRVCQRGHSSFARAGLHTSLRPCSSRSRRPISTCLLGLLPLAVGLLIPITLLCFPKPRADLHLVATCELELRLGVRLGFQVALVHTFRQRTHGCIHAQALRRLDVLSGAALASRAQASPVLHPRV